MLATEEYLILESQERETNLGRVRSHINRQGSAPLGTDGLGLLSKTPSQPQGTLAHLIQPQFPASSFVPSFTPCWDSHTKVPSGF